MYVQRKEEGYFKKLKSVRKLSRKQLLAEDSNSNSIRNQEYK